RNISLMAPAPAIEDAADTLLEPADGIDFGLHVTLTSEWDSVRWGPVKKISQVPDLVRRDGTFRLLVGELDAAGPSTDELIGEVEAQYNRLKSLGFTLTYLDEHMLVGSVGTLADELRSFASVHDLAYDRDLKADGTLSLLPDWAGPGEHPGTELADYLSGVAGGTYLLFGHPGTKNEEMQLLKTPGGRPGEVAMRRNRERRMFMDIEIIDYCENAGIELLRYSEI
ncbi:MAG: ChbG/HpnK family deacetylase, partial [Spirochaetia bacterium]